jgi:broad specificity phosphatase PhoE
MTIEIYFVRHGSTDYKFPEPFSQNFEEASDLTTLGIEEIKNTCQDIIKEFEKEKNYENVLIYSSPIPRSMFSARIIYEKLSKKKLNIKNFKVNINEEFEEVRRFGDFNQTLNILMNGGNISENEKTYSINKIDVNPKSISYPEYYIYEEFKKIKIEILPDSLKNWVRNVETFKEVSGRNLECLYSITDKLDKKKNHKIIIVSHEALCFSLVNAGTSGKYFTQDRGKYLKLERVNSSIFVIGSNFINKDIKKSEDIKKTFQKNFLLR